MKKYLLIIAAFSVLTPSVARKVKFSVNMTGQTINTTGIHIMASFQFSLGCPVDFDPACTQLAQETTDTNIYSIIVDIPAFVLYEYRYVNGDQSYEAEFVPLQSRVDAHTISLNDNRWLWVDSLADDTTDVGAILFSGNAPANLTLLRFKVDMHEQTSVNPAGVHVAGDFQAWDPTKIMMYSFGLGMYEIIAYLPAGTYEFKYYNGNMTADAESVPGSCAVNNNRQVALNADTILHDDATFYPVCFSGCNACITAGVEENNLSAEINIYPNPATNQFEIRNSKFEISCVDIYDMLGSRVLQFPISSFQFPISVSVSSLTPGIYFVRVSDADNSSPATSKLVIE